MALYHSSRVMESIEVLEIALVTAALSNIIVVVDKMPTRGIINTENIFVYC